MIIKRFGESNEAQKGFPVTAGICEKWRSAGFEPNWVGHTLYKVELI